MKFKQFLREESPVMDPKYQKEFEALGAHIKYKDRYKELFKDEDRIYLPVGGSVIVKPDDFDFDFYEGIMNRLRSLEDKYGVSFDFKQDYIKSKITFIPKALGIRSKNIKDKEKLDYTYEEFANKYSGEAEKRQFKSLPSIGKHDDLEVMISRNPCDIGAMSTGTHWSSCMNLYDGLYNKYTRHDVAFGTLVVYLIDSDDKKAIKPLGRKLIKPYINYGDKLRKELLVLTKPTYGIFTKEAEDVVRNWLDKHQKDIEGYFRLHTNLYQDDDVPTVKKEKK